MQQPTPLRNQPIIVAVDGSPETEAALERAARHARTHGHPLRIITCYRHIYERGSSQHVSWSSFTSTKNQARADAVETIRSVLGANPDVAFEHVLELGPLEPVLQDHARNAAMVVVPARHSDHCDPAGGARTSAKCLVITVGKDQSVPVKEHGIQDIAA